jgi:hypothetical protein
MKLTNEQYEKLALMLMFLRYLSACVVMLVGIPFGALCLLHARLFVHDQDREPGSGSFREDMAELWNYLVND